jgi:hypothetical protein
VDPTEHKGRGLFLKNKQAVLKYREVFQSKLFAHNIFNWCQALWDSPAGADILILQTEVEAIDREVTKAALQVECSTETRTFGYAWSPTLAEAGQHVTIWRNCLKAAKHHQDPFSTLVPSQLQYHGIKHTGLNLAFYKSRLDDACSHLSMVQDNVWQLWKEFLASLLSNAEHDKEKTKVAKLKAILQAEYVKILWPKLRKYVKGETRSGLDQVKIPTRDSAGEITGWRSVTAPAELFQTLLARNLTRFAQAKDTQFVAGTLGQQLHPFEQNQFSEFILHGTADLSNLNLSASIHDCIHEMCYPPGEDGSDPVSDLISPEDFSNGFKQL